MDLNNSISESPAVSEIKQILNGCEELHHRPVSSQAAASTSSEVFILCFYTGEEVNIEKCADSQLHETNIITMYRIVELFKPKLVESITAKHALIINRSNELSTDKLNPSPSLQKLGSPRDADWEPPSQATLNTPQPTLTPSVCPPTPDPECEGSQFQYPPSDKQTTLQRSPNPPGILFFLRIYYFFWGFVTCDIFCF